jgi:hypothetical protein
LRSFFDKGTPKEVRLVSPDPGRALITGIANDLAKGIINDPTLEHTKRIQDFAAARHPAHDAALPRQLRQDARECGAPLREFLLCRIGGADPADSTRRAGHRRLQKVAGLNRTRVRWYARHKGTELLCLFSCHGPDVSYFVRVARRQVRMFQIESLTVSVLAREFC